jgi:hypothetical protein
MSKVAITGNASGTGTFTISSPNSNSDRTLTLPDNSGTVLTSATPGVPVNGPAFSAYQSVTNQSFSTNTWTKSTLSLEYFDTNLNFDTSTYRFTPTVAGYYQFTGAAILQSGSSNITFIACSLYRNGVAASYGSYGGTVSTASYGITVDDILYMNGSTDYVELYMYATATAPFATNGRLSGALIRSAT